MGFCTTDRTGSEAESETKSPANVNLAKIFPWFILYFIAASVITTLCFHFIKDETILNTVKPDSKPLVLGAVCWIGITGVSLVLQHVMDFW